MKPSQVLTQHRRTVKAIFDKYPLISNPRVFGSVCRGEDTEGSDIDFLIDAQRGVTLFMLARLHNELKGVLGTNIDLLTEAQLPPKQKSEILREAVSL